MFLNNWHYYIKIMSIIYLGIVYYAYAASKWRTILNITFLIALFCAAAVAGATVTVPLRRIYVPL